MPPMTTTGDISYRTAGYFSKQPDRAGYAVLHCRAVLLWTAEGTFR